MQAHSYKFSVARLSLFWNITSGQQIWALIYWKCEGSTDTRIKHVNSWLQSEASAVKNALVFPALLNQFNKTWLTNLYLESEQLVPKFVNCFFSFFRLNKEFRGISIVLRGVNVLGLLFYEHTLQTDSVQYDAWTVLLTNNKCSLSVTKCYSAANRQNR